MRTAIIVTDANEGTLAGGLTYVRPAVAWFAIAMERQLELNAHKGDSYRRDTPAALAERLAEESAELIDACLYGSPDEILAEAADVGNFAWMIAEVASRHYQPRPADPGNPPKETNNGKDQSRVD